MFSNVLGIKKPFFSASQTAHHIPYIASFLDQIHCGQPKEHVLQCLSGRISFTISTKDEIMRIFCTDPDPTERQSEAIETSSMRYISTEVPMATIPCCAVNPITSSWSLMIMLKKSTGVEQVTNTNSKPRTASEPIQALSLPWCAHRHNVTLIYSLHIYLSQILWSIQEPQEAKTGELAHQGMFSNSYLHFSFAASTINYWIRNHRSYQRFFHFWSDCCPSDHNITLQKILTVFISVKNTTSAPHFDAISKYLGLHWKSIVSRVSYLWNNWRAQSLSPTSQDPNSPWI